jgi:N-formylglutamate amidohydrolase
LLEDRLADRLIWRATDAGATAFIASAPRAEIDLNRDEREIDPAIVDPPLGASQILPSARARGGVGLVPTRMVGTGAIWRGPIARQELSRRITLIHQPYHRAIAQSLAGARERFGAALLLDCHSMPPRGGPADAQVLFGDRHGTTTSLDVRSAAVEVAETLGFSTACNAPYSGGHLVTAHGRPELGIHALQVEIDRSLYLDDSLRQPGPGFARVCVLVEALVEALAARLTGTDRAIAAE